ncbi:MAG: SCP2 sterol-binding domain-containing protein [Deltaproteobacteria bacterium]|nr:SCP2 sterol-binding domain-containing protein [Deltaproteobacteria bacterium]MBW2360671.1 SCP2 sterol-binding domain-containing protein [Deltaproteobacteria bacterium]
MPNEFFEGFLGKALARVRLPKRVQGPIGVVLRGRDGGEWSVHLGHTAARVEAGLDDALAFTWVQSVDDWRGALWEGRGGEGGKWAQLAFNPARVAQFAQERPLPNAPSAAIGELARAAGLFELRITGAPGGDWAAAVQLGSGPVASKPDARLTLSDDDAVALAGGAVSPLEAFVKGRVHFDGDSSLLLKLPGLARAAAGL